MLYVFVSSGLYIGHSSNPLRGKIQKIDPVKININTIFIKFILKFKKIMIKITENKNTLEANAWTRKYFKEDSEENKFFEFIIKGIKDSKLISNPIHTPNQEEDEIVINVPVNKVKKNKNL